MSPEEKQVRLSSLLLGLDRVTQEVYDAFWGPAGRQRSGPWARKVWSGAVARTAEVLLGGSGENPGCVLHQEFLAEQATRSGILILTDAQQLRWERAAVPILRALELPEGPSAGVARSSPRWSTWGD